MISNNGAPNRTNKRHAIVRVNSDHNVEPRRSLIGMYFHSTEVSVPLPARTISLCLCPPFPICGAAQWTRTFIFHRIDEPKQTHQQTIRTYPRQHWPILSDFLSLHRTQCYVGGKHIFDGNWKIITTDSFISVQIRPRHERRGRQTAIFGHTV